MGTWTDGQFESIYGKIERWTNALIDHRQVDGQINMQAAKWAWQWADKITRCHIRRKGFWS